jgi:hypothetical protein
MNDGYFEQREADFTPQEQEEWSAQAKAHWDALPDLDDDLGPEELADLEADAIRYYAQFEGDYLPSASR